MIRWIWSLFLSITLFSFGFAQNDSKRYVAHGLLNLEKDPNHAISLMTKMVGSGCNSVLLTVWWERVYPTAEARPNWTQIDNQINHAVNNLGVKVAIRIHLGRNFSTIKGFWSEEESVADFKGKPLTLYYDNNHFSFAHQPTIEKASGFVKEVCERYKSLQKSGKILFVSVVNTPQQEIGYTYENQQFPSPSYTAMFDHSKWSMIKWKDWAKEKYTTIRTLNSFWGTTYRNFLEVEPFVNIWNTKDSFRGRRGKDWYIFRHTLLKNYTDAMVAAIKSVDSSYEVACEYGGVVDNLSQLRGTMAFKSLTEKADIIKTITTGFQGDIINTNKGKKKYYTEVAFFDLATPELLRNYVTRAIEYDCKFIMLITDYEDGYNKILPAVQEAAKWIDKPSAPIVYADSVHYRLSQLIDDLDSATEDWRLRSANGSKKIKISFEEDILLEKQKIDNPLPDIVDNNPIIISPPPPPNPDEPNKLPLTRQVGFTKEVVINQYFKFSIPDNLFYDPDGFIAFVEAIEIPSWISFNRFEFSFAGKPNFIGKYKIKLRIYDNDGASSIFDIYIQSTPPVVDFELIKAGYFDEPIVGLGYIFEGRKIFMDEKDSQKGYNILARCNLDSVQFKFELVGPYKFKSVSGKNPYNVFGEGKGIFFPIGKYTLSATALRKDSLITQKTLNFYVVPPNSNSVLNDWVSYPNPFENICNVKMPNDLDLKTVSFRVTSLNGKRIEVPNASISIVENTAYIDLGSIGLSAGHYFMEILNNNQILKTIKITKI